MMLAGVFILAFTLVAQGAYLSSSDNENGEISMREALEQPFLEKEIDGAGVVKENIVSRGFERRSTPTDDEVKADYMAAHIRHRKEASPTATNMMYIKWSDELAGIAQSWADTCSWTHNPDRSSDSPTFGYVGENKYLRTGNFNMTRSVDYWMLEADKYDFDTRTCSSGICSHYTQVVWHNSEYVGCGIKFCASMEGLSGWNDVYFHVCNYGPGGNYNGQDPYTSGTTCDDCTSDEYVEPFCCKDNQCLK